LFAASLFVLLSLAPSGCASGTIWRFAEAVRSVEWLLRCVRRGQEVSERVDHLADDALASAAVEGGLSA
jgi:hypothetical protein